MFFYGFGTRAGLLKLLNREKWPSNAYFYVLFSDISMAYIENAKFRTKSGQTLDHIRRV